MADKSEFVDMISEATRQSRRRIVRRVVEPVLKKCAEESPSVDVRFNWRLESFAQDDVH